MLRGAASLAQLLTSPYGVHAWTAHYNVWVLWGSDGKPMFTDENTGESVGPVVNLLWHSLENTIKSNSVAPLPRRSTGWQRDKECVRATFLKNIKYIISHREEWRVIVHVCSLLPCMFFRALTLFLLVCQVNEVHYEPLVSSFASSSDSVGSSSNARL